MKKEVEDAKKLVAEDHKNANVTSSKVVCYSYPKIGLMADIQESKSREEKSRLFDFSGSEIIDKSINDTNSSEITDVWSLYSEIPEEEIEERLMDWEKYDKRAKEIADNNFEEDEVQIRIAGIQKTLSLTYYRQISPIHCAAATTQMIAKYYGATHTQQYIADEMGIDTSGVSAYRQVKYYYKPCLEKTGSYVDYSPTWLKAKNEIYAGRPLVSGIGSGLGGHTRACAGYCQGTDGNYYLYIYDPWDPSFGDDYPGGKYWENFDSVIHAHYIFVR